MGGGGSGTGEQCLKPNCVLSNPSAEDSSPSPSRLPDKCRSRPPVCQGCLNWYQDVPGLHRPGHCLPPACLLPLQSLASLWLPTSIPGSTGPRGVGASRTSPPRALVRALPSPSRRQFNVPGPGRHGRGGGMQRSIDRHGCISTGTTRKGKRVMWESFAEAHRRKQSQNKVTLETAQDRLIGPHRPSGYESIPT